MPAKSCFPSVTLAKILQLLLGVQGWPRAPSRAGAVGAGQGRRGLLAQLALTCAPVWHRVRVLRMGQWHPSCLAGMVAGRANLEMRHTFCKLLKAREKSTMET